MKSLEKNNKGKGWQEQGQPYKTQRRGEINTMKKRVTTVRRLVRTTVTLATVLSLLLLSSYIESHYKRQAIVDTIENNVVTFIDSCGYTWTAINVDNITEGQTVTLKMYTNNTNSIITDDEIVKIEPTAITLQ